MTISQNQALYSLLGTQFGGDGKTTFALPDLRSRTPMGISSYSQQGKAGGTETVTLTAAQVQPHTHQVAVTNQGGAAPSPSSNFLATMVGQATVPPFNAYAPYPTVAGQTVALAPTTVGVTGSGGGHENRQPSLALNFCIATTGTYPMRSDV